MEQIDRFKSIWEIQCEQQKELRLDPDLFSDAERARVFGELIRQLYEECNDVSQLLPDYKRHVIRLKSGKASGLVAAFELADVLKVVLAIAQLLGVSDRELYHAFLEKSMLISEKFASERIELAEHTKLIAVDLDDVIADLSDWRSELGIVNEWQTSPALRLEASESMKNEFYANGRFRDLEPVPGATDTLNELSAAGFKIAIITARPQWQYKRLHSDTVYWLRKWNVPYDLLIFNRNKVEAVYGLAPAWPQFFIEDHPRNVVDLAEARINVLAFERPHNESQFVEGDCVKIVRSWQEIYRHCMEK